MAGDLSRLAELVGAALQDWARSSSAESRLAEPNDYQLVGPNTTLVFDWENPRLNIELPQLKRILENAATHANTIYAYLTEQDANALGRGERAKLHTTQRLAVTMRDSLGQMARLVVGEDLDEPEQANTPEAVGLTEESKLREAEIFMHLKQALRHEACNDPVFLKNKILEVMEFIKEGGSKNADGR